MGRVVRTTHRPRRALQHVESGPETRGNERKERSLARSDSTIQTALNLFHAGETDRAKESLVTFLKRFPAEAPALRTLAMIHGALNEDQQALAAISRAAAIEPRNVEYRFMRANVLMLLKKYKDAAEEYRTVIKLAPQESAPYDALARCLISLEEAAAALEIYERSLALFPDNEDAYKRMATTLSIIGRIDDSLAVTRRGLSRLPRSTALLEQLCYNSNFAPCTQPQDLRNEHAALGDLVRTSSTRSATTRSPDRSANRPLHVAFISSDFIGHACSFFLEGLLSNLDHARVRPFMFHTRDAHDAVTARLASYGTFRHLPTPSPDSLAAACDADQIDIAIDCCGWTDNNTLRAFVPRLAPVQATWLGYPNTTGIPTMDFRIVDAITDPPGAESHATERLVRLPRTFISYLPPRDAPDPAAIPAPHAQNPSGGIVFGSFNRVTKVGPDAMNAWARVLLAVPNSTLLVKAQVASGLVQRQFLERMASFGVSSERIRTCEYTDAFGSHMPMYRRMDIALDSFPYNGTTTTCEALWMGVPVVALAGNCHRARVGASLLTSVGLTDLLATDIDGYVRAAKSLAEDRPRLQQLHTGLRARMAASPLCDHAAYARDFESALHTMWQTFLDGGISP